MSMSNEDVDKNSGALEVPKSASEITKSEFPVSGGINRYFYFNSCSLGNHKSVHLKTASASTNSYWDNPKYSTRNEMRDLFIGFPLWFTFVRDTLSNPRVEILAYTGNFKRKFSKEYNKITECS